MTKDDYELITRIVNGIKDTFEAMRKKYRAVEDIAYIIGCMQEREARINNDLEEIIIDTKNGCADTVPVNRKALIEFLKQEAQRYNTDLEKLKDEIMKERGQYR